MSKVNLRRMGEGKSDISDNDTKTIEEIDQNDEPREAYCDLCRQSLNQFILLFQITERGGAHDRERRKEGCALHKINRRGLLAGHSIGHAYMLRGKESRGDGMDPLSKSRKSRPFI